MIKWIVKKVIVGKINDLLDQHKDNVNKVKETLKIWICRLEKILSCFKSTLAKLDDSKIDPEEIDQTVAEVESIIQKWDDECKDCCSVQF